MQAVRAELVERLEQRLRTSANAGGWGYYAGKGSRLEPTCWALLALRGASADGSADIAGVSQPHISYLTSLSSDDGLLVETEPSLANVTANALALITLRALGGAAAGGTIDRLQAALVELKGVRATEADPRQDNSLQGWPWVRDTFSWVEPTAWALLALKLNTRSPASAAAVARQSEAERLLLNRVCVGGGWNYGNASTLGQDLRAYAPTTAVALLALQDRRSTAAVQESLTMLVEHQTSERGAMTLALVSICLNIFGLSTDAVDTALMDAAERSESSGNLLATAMALFALSFEHHRGDVLRVA